MNEDTVQCGSVGLHCARGHSGSSCALRFGKEESVHKSMKLDEILEIKSNPMEFKDIPCIQLNPMGPNIFNIFN